MSPAGTKLHAKVPNNKICAFSANISSKENRHAVKAMSKKFKPRGVYSKSRIIIISYV